MDNVDVAVLFATTNKNGKSKNMFIDGNVIYSYGYHFKIAEKKNNKTVYLTTRKYSNTTSRHVSHVRNALQSAGKTIIDKELLTNN